jgi:hypothetical protein
MVICVYKPTCLNLISLAAFVLSVSHPQFVFAEGFALPTLGEMSVEGCSGVEVNGEIDAENGHYQASISGLTLNHASNVNTPTTESIRCFLKLNVTPEAGWKVGISGAELNGFSKMSTGAHSRISTSYALVGAHSTRIERMETAHFLKPHSNVEVFNLKIEIEPDDVQWSECGTPFSIEGTIEAVSQQIKRNAQTFIDFGQSTIEWNWIYEQCALQR